MTDEQIRVAIALECGFKGCQEVACSYRKCQHLHKGGRVYFPESYSIPRYPDYLNDLNAMHEAEEMLHPNECEPYAADLCKIVGNYWFTQGKATINFTQQAWLYATAHATARQRAEAFLRTIGKWTE